MTSEKQEAMKTSNSSSSIGTYQQEPFGGSNDFILISDDTTDESVASLIKRKIRNTCSKKTLYRRLPVLNWLPKYNTTNAISDLIAGITVGLTVIPQGLAYSSIIGVSPEYGLYSSFLGCFVYIFFGSCKEAAIGPTAIVAMLTAETIKARGAAYATLLCFLTGVVQILMGFFGLGFLIDFISGPVSSGFISAAAILIVSSQINCLLGIKVSTESLVRTIKDVVQNIGDTHTGDAVMGFSCIAVLLLLREIGRIKLGPKSKDESPNKCQAILNTTLWLISIARNAILVVACTIISFYYCETSAPPFHITGDVPAGFPTVQPPPFSAHDNKTGETLDFFDMVGDLSSGIIVVPLVALLEQIGVCKAFADGKSVNATQEFMAIGLCNIANSFVQAFPGTGALARSAVNHNSGVKTTMGGLYTGGLVILSLLFLTPYFYYIPKATLAAIMIAAAVFMVEVRVVKPMWKAKKSDLIPGFATFISCLFLPIQYGIIIGIGINIMFIMYHAARPKISMEKLTSDEGVNYLLLTPDRCLIFPSVNYVRNLVTKHSIQQGIPVVIDCSHIYGADFTAATVIKILTQDFKARRQPLFFYNLKPSVSSMIDGLSPTEFVVFYNKEEFDEMLKRWWIKRRNSVNVSVINRAK